MRATFTLRPSVTIDEAIGVLDEITTKQKRIENDPHTNKHFELIYGAIWKKGDGVGRMWDYLCNSRTAQRQAQEMLRI